MTVKGIRNIFSVSCMARAFLLALVVIVGGCAQTSGVTKLGPDTYTITTYRSLFRGGTPEAKRDAFSSANEYCEKQNQEVLVNNIEITPTDRGTDHVSIIFKCLNRSDRDYKRPSYDRQPNTVIEDRRGK